MEMMIEAGVATEPRSGSPTQRTGAATAEAPERSRGFTMPIGGNVLQLPAAGAVAFVRGVRVSAIEVYGGQPFYVLSWR